MYTMPCVIFGQNEIQVQVTQGEARRSNKIASRC